MRLLDPPNIESNIESNKRFRRPLSRIQLFVSYRISVGMTRDVTNQRPLSRMRLVDPPNIKSNIESNERFRRPLSRIQLFVLIAYRMRCIESATPIEDRWFALRQQPLGVH